MKGPEYQNRWNSPKQLYEGFLNAQRKDSISSNGTQNTQTRITKIGVPAGSSTHRVLNQTDDAIRRPNVDGIRKELPQSFLSNQHLPTDKSKKINALKTDITSFKQQVGRLISIDRDFTNVHNSLNGDHHQVNQYPEHYRTVDGYQTPRQTYSGVNGTAQKKPIESYQTRVLTEQPTAAKPIRYETSFAVEQQLREQLRQSTLKQKKLAEERDELLKKLQQKPRQGDNTRGQNNSSYQQQYQSSSTLSDRFKISQASQRSTETVIEGLRKQNSQMQSHYKFRLQEADRQRKNLQKALISKDMDINNIKNQLLQTQKILKSQENLIPTVDSLRQSNRKLQRQIIQLNSKIRNQQQRSFTIQDKFNRAEESKRTIEAEITRQKEQMQNVIQNNRYLNDQLSNLSGQCNRMRVELLQLRQFKQTVHQQRQSSFSKESSLVQRTGALSKSAIMNNSSQNLLEVGKKQELEKLSQRIEELRKDKKVLQGQIRGLCQTKSALEESLRNLPQIKTVEQLRGQVLLKQNQINKLMEDVTNLQNKIQNEAKLQARIRSSDTLLRQANQALIKRGLEALNRRYH